MLLFGQCGVNCFKSVFNWTNGQLSIVLIPYGQQSLVCTTHVVVVVTWCPKHPEKRNHPQADTSFHQLFWMSSLSNLGLKKNSAQPEHQSQLLTTTFCSAYHWKAPLGAYQPLARRRRARQPPRKRLKVAAVAAPPSEV